MPAPYKTVVEMKQPMFKMALLSDVHLPVQAHRFREKNHYSHRGEITLSNSNNVVSQGGEHLRRLSKVM